MKLLKFLWVEFTYNGHMQSLGAACIVYGASKLFLWEPVVYPIISTYILFQLVYIYDRYHDLHDDYTTNKKRSEHLFSYARYIPIIFLIYYLILVTLLFTRAHFYGMLFTLFILGMGVLYPIFFKNLTKKIFLFKNIYVSSVFALMAFYGNIFTYTFNQSFIFTFFVALYVFIETMIMQFTLDCKDIDADRLKHLKTLPVQYGKEKTIQIIYILISVKALSYIVLTYVNGTAGVSWLVYIISMTTLINFIAIYLVSKNYSVGYLISAGKFLLWGIVFNIEI